MQCLSLLSLPLLLFALASIANASDYKPEPSREECVELAKKVYPKLAIGDQTFVKLSILFESVESDTKVLEQCIDKYTVSWSDNKTLRFHKLLHKPYSKELCEHLSSDNTMELKAILAVEFPELSAFKDYDFKNYDPKEKEALLRPFFVKLAKKAYETEIKGDLTMEQLFGSLFEARLLMQYIEGLNLWFMKRTTKLRKLLYKKDSNRLYEHLSSDNAVKLKVLLFDVLPEVEIDDYLPNERSTSLRSFFVNLAKAYKIDEKQANISTDMLFGSRLKARLVMWYFKDKVCDVVSYAKIRQLLYGKSDALLESLPLDSAIKLKFILSRAFNDDGIVDSIEKDTARRFSTGAISAIYKNTQQAQESMLIDQVFAGSQFDADLMIWRLDKASKDIGEKARKLLYKNEIKHKLYSELTPSQIHELGEALFHAFPEVEIKDYAVRGEEAIRPFCVRHAKGVYGKNYGDNDVSPHMLFGTNVESGKENKHNTRLLTWCIERFDDNDIGEKTKKLLYKNDNTMYDWLLSCDVTELQRYLFQVFPEVETDTVRFKDCPDRTKAFCKELITDAHEKLKGKDITTTVAVFGSQLQAKLTIPCLQTLGDKQYAQDAQKLLYAEPTTNIYPVLGDKQIKALANILAPTVLFFTSASDQNNPSNTNK